MFCFCLLLEEGNHQVEWASDNIVMYVVWTNFSRLQVAITACFVKQLVFPVFQERSIILSIFFTSLLVVPVHVWHCGYMYEHVGGSQCTGDSLRDACQLCTARFPCQWILWASVLADQGMLVRGTILIFNDWCCILECSECRHCCPRLSC